ncbi:hypothetical protein BCR37DRAFT_378964 [Protomyces lactucae-debilis]|uniref:Major facilitator superfamily domain-containing protein n=1 Tax=Protomyces lactucae-debilis TaxID=2754530 RepID=A0A1Y2FGG0_PROLT|nr:uncharacterized protein BCR37DRAFT_378964 [Protomyces lactucae-debilis]ORY83021.1 hypothetical protein BCR37DRAFT_378964 [Protomyces lactucae-debilis]
MPLGQGRFAKPAGIARIWFAIYALLVLAAYFGSTLALLPAVSKDLGFDLADTIFLFALWPVSMSLLPVYGQISRWICPAHMKTVGYLTATGFLLLASYATRPCVLLIYIALCNIGLASAAAVSIGIICKFEANSKTIKISLCLLPILLLCGIALGAVGVTQKDWRFLLRSWAIKFAIKSLWPELLEWLSPDDRQRLRFRDALIDWWAALYWTLGIGLIAWGASFSVDADSGWRRTVVLLSLVLGCILLVSLVVLERRTRSEVALFPRRLLSAAVWVFCAMSFFTCMALGIYLLYVVKTLITIDHHSEYATAARLIPFAVSATIGLLSGKLLFKWFEGAHIVLFVTPLAALGMLLFSLTEHRSATVQLVMGIVSTLLVGINTAIALYMAFASVCAPKSESKEQLSLILVAIVALGIAFGPALTSRVIGASRKRGHRIKGIQRALWVAAALMLVTQFLAVVHCIVYSARRRQQAESEGNPMPSSSASSAEGAIEMKEPAAGTIEAIAPDVSTSDNVTPDSHASGDLESGGQGNSKDKRNSFTVPKKAEKSSRRHFKNIGARTLKSLIKKPSALDALPKTVEETTQPDASEKQDNPASAKDKHENHVPGVFRKMFMP